MEEYIESLRSVVCRVLKKPVVHVRCKTIETKCTYIETKEKTETNSRKYSLGDVISSVVGIIIVQCCTRIWRGNTFGINFKSSLYNRNSHYMQPDEIN